MPGHSRFVKLAAAFAVTAAASIFAVSSATSTRAEDEIELPPYTGKEYIMPTEASVARIALSDAISSYVAFSGKHVTIDAAVLSGRGNRTIVTYSPANNPMNAEDRLRATLWHNGLALSRVGGAMTIVSLADAVRIAPLVNDQGLAAAHEWEVVSSLVPFATGRAQAVNVAIKSVLSGDGGAVTLTNSVHLGGGKYREDDGGALLVTDYAGNVRRARDIAAGMTRTVGNPAAVVSVDLPTGMNAQEAVVAVRHQTSLDVTGSKDGRRLVLITDKRSAPEHEALIRTLLDLLK